MSGSSVSIVFFIAGIFLIEPLFNSYKPAPPGPVRDEVVAMAKQVGVPSNKILIYDGSKQATAIPPTPAVLFGFGQVAMSDVMFKPRTPTSPRNKGVVSHESGHYVRKHVLLGALFQGVVAVVGLFLVSRLFGWAARLGRKGLDELSPIRQDCRSSR